MINFLKYRKVTALSSLSLIIAFATVAIYRQQTRGSVYRYSVDFTGGTQVLFGFSQDVDASQVLNNIKILSLITAGLMQVRVNLAIMKFLFVLKNLKATWLVLANA